MAEFGYRLINFYIPYCKGILLNQVDAIFVSRGLYQRLVDSELRV